MTMMNRGFTMIEILLAITLMALLVGVYFFVANPAGQLRNSRNTERQLQLQAIMNAVRQNIADSQTGQFVCASGSIPTTSAVMASGGASGTYNIAPCLIPTYLFAMPFDPSTSSSSYVSTSSYNTNYSISISSSSGVVTLSAPYTETTTANPAVVSVSR